MHASNNFSTKIIIAAYKIQARFSISDQLHSSDATETNMFYAAMYIDIFILILSGFEKILNKLNLINDKKISTFIVRRYDLYKLFRSKAFKRHVSLGI